MHARGRIERVGVLDHAALLEGGADHPPHTDIAGIVAVPHRGPVHHLVEARDHRAFAEKADLLGIAEMAAATRQLGMLAYVQPRATMAQLLSLVAEDIPLIVLQNNSIGWLPQWHYAVVIGYDLDSAEVILHTGVTPNHRLNFATFERTWQRGNYWLLAMLPPDKASAQLDAFLYTKASQDLLSTGQTKAALSALQTATKQWPEYWLPYFLLGNHYFSAEPLVAAAWFDKGLANAQQEVSYLNNYAVLLSELGCYSKATKLINSALKLQPQDNNLLDSQQQILTAQQAGADTVSQCRLDVVNRAAVKLRAETE